MLNFINEAGKPDNGGFLMAKAVEVRDLVKWYGKTLALNGVTFDVDAGDFFVIMGPSGCGKSTTMKILAGLLDWDSGEVYINGKNMRGVPAYKRDVSLMLETYALFPHMTVYDNIAFGLRMLGKPEDEIKKKVEWALELVGMPGFEKRFPDELSGGQRQRVALARSLVVEPSVLLLDEPLSHVDYRLMRKLIEDLKIIHKKVGNTFILTTHYQEQGLSMADTLMIMNTGVVEQIGTPEEIYWRPRTVFAARFVGEINLFSGTVKSKSDGGYYVKTEIGEFEGIVPYESSEEIVGKNVAYGIRLERVMLTEEESKLPNKIKAELSGYYFFGDKIEYVFTTESGQIIKMSKPTLEEEKLLEVGKKYVLGWRTKDGIILEKPCMIEGLNIEEVIYGK